MPGHTRLQKITPVPRENWSDLLDRFSSTNRGRKVKLERFGGPSGAARIEEGLPLMGIAYNPEGKGDTVTISFGKLSLQFEHRIERPLEVWVEQHQEDQGPAMEIVDGDGGHVLITIQ